MEFFFKGGVRVVKFPVFFGALLIRRSGVKMLYENAEPMESNDILDMRYV